MGGILLRRPLVCGRFPCFWIIATSACKTQWRGRAGGSGGQFPSYRGIWRQPHMGSRLGRDEDVCLPASTAGDEEQRHYHVVNAGVTGDTQARPYAVSTGAGARDEDHPSGHRRQRRAERCTCGTVERNLAAMIERAQARGIRVFLCGMEAPPSACGSATRWNSTAYKCAGRALPPDAGPLLLTGLIGNDEWNLNDSLHPNAAGHRVIADAIWPHLRPML